MKLQLHSFNFNNTTTHPVASVRFSVEDFMGVGVMFATLVRFYKIEDFSSDDMRLFIFPRMCRIGFVEDGFSDVYNQLLEFSNKQLKFVVLPEEEFEDRKNDVPKLNDFYSTRLEAIFEAFLDKFRVNQDLEEVAFLARNL